MSSAIRKPALLFLCHRIPFPPDKGDKIRSYHLLKYLSNRYRVFLGCFIDDEEDKQYIQQVKSYCEEGRFIVINPTLCRLKSIKALFTGEPMTLPYYANSDMQTWVKDTLEKHDINLSVAFSSSMAQYFRKRVGGKIVVDFVDVDSDKWRQYSKTKMYPLKYIYQREADRLLAFEKDIVRISDKSFLVSSSEATLFKRLVGDHSHKIGFYNNGVDTSYFNPHQWFHNPYRESSPVLVFTGAMDYWPNVDAVVWFSRVIYPELRKLRSNLKFYIVGRNPTRAVTRLKSIDGITVTGRVDDIRPYLKYATAVVAPLRIARGVQNKILEAMAMEKVVMASDAGLEGIEADLGLEVLLTNTVDDYCEFLPKILQHNCSFIGEAARQRVIRDFNWDHTLPKVGASLDGDARRELEHD